MDADTPATESGSNDPVAMFESVLSKSFGEEPAAPATPAAKAPAAAAPAPAAPASAATAPAPAIPDVLDALGDDALPADDPDAEIDPDADPAAPAVFKVKVDGKEIEVPADELVKGYSRQQDYTKKTMELAAQRQQVDQAAAQMQAERNHYQQQLQHLTSVLGEQLSAPPDWQELLNNDPVEYLKQQHLYQTRQAAYQNAMQAKQQTEQLTQQQAAQAEQQRQVHEREQLLANLPSWSDGATAAKEKAVIVKTLTALGRTPEQLGKLDHIDVIIARKAALYDQMVAKAKDTTAKVAALPPRMQKPGATRPTDGRTADMQALRKSGSTSDAAALFEKML